jgi:hypothetical protein
MQRDAECFHIVPAGKMFYSQAHPSESVIITIEEFYLDDTNKHPQRWHPFTILGCMRIICKDNPEEPFIIKQIIKPPLF